MANTPAANADEHADEQRAASSTSTPSSPGTRRRNSKTIAPAVIGVAMRKLKRAAASRSRPANRPAEMEIPDRLMPGIRASAWAAPMPIAIGNVTSSMPPVRATEPVSQPQDHAADDEGDAPTSGRLAEPSSMMSLRRNPATAAGMVAATSSQARRRSGSPGNERSRIVGEPGGHEPEPVRAEVDEQRARASRGGASR